MTAPAFAPMVGGRKAPPDQAARRIDLKIPDQHGRKIHVIFDRIAMGTIQKLPQFKAPWIPDINYLREDPDDPNPIPTRQRWDYQKCLADNHVAWDRWFDECRTIAGRMPGVDAMAAYEAAKRGEWHKVPAALLREVGDTPEPDDYIKAAMANNAWVLGFTDIVPKWAEPLEKLKDARRRQEARAVTEEDLDEYRDASPDVAAALDDAYEAQGLVGATVPIGPPKRGPGRPKKDQGE